MKITGFNPSILTSKPDEIIRLFEDLGFEKSHHDDSESGIVSGSVRVNYPPPIEAGACKDNKPD